MSHFTVAILCGTDIDPTDDKAVNDRVEELMAPYSEHIKVERYHKYADPDDSISSWLYSLGTDETIRDITGDPPPSPEYGETTGDERKAIVDAYREADDAWTLQAIEKLGIERTLESLNRYGDDSEVWGHDEQGFYYWTTYNPLSKWDYWTIGGRWAGALLVKPEADGGRNPEVPWEFTFGTQLVAEKTGMSYIPGAAGTRLASKDANRLGDKNPYKGRRVDVARIADIDFEGKAALERAERAKQLSDYDYDVATGTEPRSAGFQHFGLDKVPETPEERAAYVDAIFGFYFYAYVTPDGAWHGKGRMGWFGASLDEMDETEYRAGFDKVIAESDPRMVIAIADCHI